VWIAAGLGIVVAGSTFALTVAWRPALHSTGVTARTTTADHRSSGPSAAAGSVVFDVPAAAALPGTPPRLPWPSTGQATVAVDGIGSLGATPTQRPVPIASLAKVMTAYLVLRDHPMSAGDNGANLTVTAEEAAAYRTEVADNESLVRVTAGEVLTERQALEALLLPSADNMARILARWDAGSIRAFTKKMNATATALRMTNTDYTDPSGYNASTRSTAGDQVLLATRAMRLTAFAQIVAMPTATIPVEGTVRNYNTLLDSDGIVGIKTGSTSWAGGCLLFAARHQVGGRTATIIGAVLGQPGNVMHGLPEALSASTRLIQATADTLSTFTPIKAEQKVATIAGTRLRAAANLTILGWPGLQYHLTLTNAAAARSAPAPGAAVGRLQLDAAQERVAIDIVH
jgi:D-alanyl-D-alanine carboxypeptidase (penicillin-binding protein 5/6)